ncbi:metallophosphoesterase [Hymenobacter aerilatus]|uniref:Metallophosphoesterase n=1 Tax=Hymenobacter aerilatus TaxID=2932251 RepID=A0A8T9SWH2_9BACT|nr:metallophosphoesterase [Hymenobacter aerilatus]UOR05063.1 metallophosphoesterase [Hymenobacter aerilatus]
MADFTFSRLAVRLAFGVLLTTAATGCDLLEFSPNDTRAPASERDLTRKNLTALAQRPVPTGGDTLRFVFTSDSQRYYDDVPPLVASINQQRGLAMVLVGGDISDFGLAREMRWVNDEFKKLNVPYFTVVGNHDLAQNGREAYQRIFGPLNYTFTYAGTRFILVNTNGREYEFNGHVPDVPWLQQQLADTVGVRRQVVMAHVPPEDGDFDAAVTPAYTSTLEQAPRLVLHLTGHNDKFSVRQPVPERVTYISGYSVAQRNYLLLTLWGRHQYKLETISY